MIEVDIDEEVQQEKDISPDASIQVEPIAETNPQEPNKSFNSSTDEEDFEDLEWLHPPPWKKSTFRVVNSNDETNNEKLESDHMETKTTSSHQRTSMSTTTTTVTTTTPTTNNADVHSSQVQLQLVDPNASKDKAQKDKSTRQLVHHDHVSKLVRDYWMHFRNYSKGRKKPLKQLIPKKVRALVFKDYITEFPTCSFKEDNLKDHLQDSLKDMKSRVNNPKDGKTTILQDEDLMR